MVLFLGCTAGVDPRPACDCASPPAPTPAPGPPPASAASSLVWIDANDEVVAGVVALPELLSNSSTGLHYVDRDGAIWPLDPNADPPAVDAFGPAGFANIYYADSACELMVAEADVRLAYGMVVEGNASGNAVTFVKSGDYLSPTIVYWMVGDDCVEFGSTYFGPVIAVVPISPPLVEWIPPLRPILTEP